jgi:hypothetical protein
MVSCSIDRSQRLDVDISNVEIGEFEIHRYEQDLFKINPDEIQQGLKAIQEKYWIFLGADLTDSTNLGQIKDFITDPELIQAYNEIEAQFPNLEVLNTELEEVLKYYKFHFPGNPNFSVYSYISGFQYEYPVQIADNTMIIGLDSYLGTDFKTYHQMGIPAYKIERMQSSYIAVDCMKEIARQLIVPPPPASTFLDEIIYYGKIMYFLDATLHNKADHLKIGFPKAKLAWCFENESNLWAFIIDNQILFSADYEIIRKFITDGPFTAAFSNESPARIGVWFGWQIVKSYMDHNTDVSLTELFKNSDSKFIFSKSKYKPIK